MNWSPIRLEDAAGHARRYLASSRPKIIASRQRSRTEVAPTIRRSGAAARRRVEFLYGADHYEHWQAIYSVLRNKAQWWGDLIPLLPPAVEHAADFEWMLHMSNQLQRLDKPQSDPPYRDHMAHQFFVLVVGDVLLTQCDAVMGGLQQALRGRLVGARASFRELDLLQLAREAWELTALFHDVGYGLCWFRERWDDTQPVYARLLGREWPVNQRLGRDHCQRCTRELRAQGVHAKSHGAVCSVEICASIELIRRRFFRLLPWPHFGVDRRQRTRATQARVACEAILLHDAANRTGAPAELEFVREPFAWLLRLCDQIHEHCRPSVTLGRGLAPGPYLEATSLRLGTDKGRLDLSYELPGELPNQRIVDFSIEKQEALASLRVAGENLVPARAQQAHDAAAQRWTVSLEEIRLPT